MSEDSSLRTEADLQRAVRALVREFKAATIFIIGSQAILMSWPDAPDIMRGTPEIDAYPDNAMLWEESEGNRGDGPALEASEHINALFGLGSQFHHTHGFYIDGVDDSTAMLPRDWRRHAIVKRLDVDGRMVSVIAPAPYDLIVSKLARLDDKDKDFVVAFHQERPLDLPLLESRISDTDMDATLAARAVAFIRGLASGG